MEKTTWRIFVSISLIFIILTLLTASIGLSWWEVDNRNDKPQPSYNIELRQTDPYIYENDISWFFIIDIVLVICVAIVGLILGFVSLRKEVPINYSIIVNVFGGGLIVLSIIVYFLLPIDFADGYEPLVTTAKIILTLLVVKLILLLVSLYLILFSYLKKILRRIAFILYGISLLIWGIIFLFIEQWGYSSEIRVGFPMWTLVSCILEFVPLALIAFEILRDIREDKALLLSECGYVDDAIKILTDIKKFNIAAKIAVKYKKDYELIACLYEMDANWEEARRYAIKARRKRIPLSFNQLVSEYNLKSRKLKLVIGILLSCCILFSFTLVYLYSLDFHLLSKNIIIMVFFSIPILIFLSIFIVKSFKGSIIDFSVMKKIYENGNYTETVKILRDKGFPNTTITEIEKRLGLSRYSYNTEEATIVQTSEIDEPKKVTIECPNCNKRFKHNVNKTTIKCPNCGTKGEL